MASRCKGALNYIGAIKKLSYISSVDVVCSKGHCFYLWESQPKPGRMPLGNILMSAAILLSDSSFTKFSCMNKILGLKQVGKTTHFRNQRTYLYPTIDFHWHMAQEKPFQQLAIKECASQAMGSATAQASVPNTVCTPSQKKQLQKNDHVSPEFSSVSLEKKNFRKALNELLEKGVNVQLILKNHQWWSSRTYEENAALLKEKWCSLLYHVVGIHKWNSGKMYDQCEQLDLDEDAQKQCLWLKKGSSTHTKLWEPEVFHSNVLKYCSKRFHFFMDGMVARRQLASIEHNNNVERSHAHVKVVEKDSTKELCYRMEYSKIKKDWVVKPVYDIKQCNFVFDIMRDVVLYVAHETVFHWEPADEKLPLNIAPNP
ncbi:hypothetical protein XELAEV_18037392mg, partial [Xenopus laevis]